MIKSVVSIVFGAATIATLIAAEVGLTKRASGLRQYHSDETPVTETEAEG